VDEIARLSYAPRAVGTKPGSAEARRPTSPSEFYNTTGDAHPLHVHEVVFEVVNRGGLVLDEHGHVARPIQLDGVITLPEPPETGFKDPVIA
jgi:hypothetical protein